MPSQVIVPHRTGPLVDAPAVADGREPAEGQEAGMGVPEAVLAAGGAALLVAVLVAGLPAWLTVVAVACLALGLALPAQAAALRAVRRRRLRRQAKALDRGVPLDVSHASVRRLVTAYGRLRRTTGPGMALDAGHLALVEVATLLGGRPPRDEELDYVVRRAEAVSALADRLADGPVPPVELAGPDSVARIEALLA
ncbi:hypothetical protein NE236_07835 [Actinoallomurus purpureus]|uniref:hypothetical protein n=1 Tax=Actinoallomurus purpureus TaxID=478114 RepID=UPI00209289D8|nr:hypothetical protein [Actinoallomurus purpureus]MCO6004888.1 hypothetical protein [Actinoallomurus purpureus]